MNIEGDEYQTLRAASDSLLQRFRILVIEFHILDKLSSHPFFRVAALVFTKLLQPPTVVQRFNIERYHPRQSNSVFCHQQKKSRRR